MGVETFRKARCFCIKPVTMRACVCETCTLMPSLLRVYKQLMDGYTMRLSLDGYRCELPCCTAEAWHSRHTAASDGHSWRDFLLCAKGRVDFGGDVDPQEATAVEDPDSGDEAQDVITSKPTELVTGTTRGTFKLESIIDDSE